MPAVQQLPRKMSKLCIEPAQKFFLEGVSWDSYELIGKGLVERPIRATYDRGRLELMMPSGEHEMIKSIWRCLVETLAEEMNLPLRSAGSMTQKWQAHEREIEADECFYIKSWPKIRGKRQFVPGVDPFSDLALEVDVTSLSIARLPIYASLRVPEVWRFEGESIHVLLLNDRGDYEESEYSPTFPGVSIAGLVPFLLMWDEDLFTIVRAFRAWLGQQLSRPKKKGKQPRRRKDT